MYIHVLTMLTANPAVAGETVTFDCQGLYPSDHERLQAELDGAVEGTTVKVRGSCEFDPPDATGAPGTVSIMKHGIRLQGPAVIHGGGPPIQVGIQGPRYGVVRVCNDPDFTCVKVRDVQVQDLELDSPWGSGIEVGASAGGLVLKGNTILTPRMAIMDITRLSPGIGGVAGCITLNSIANSEIGNPSFRFGPDIITGDTDIRENTCLGGAAHTTADDPEGRWYPRVAWDPVNQIPVGGWIKGAFTGIFIENANTEVQIVGNHVEDVFRPGIWINADSELFQPHADLLRITVRDNLVIQSAPSIVFWPGSGILAATNPATNAGPHSFSGNDLTVLEPWFASPPSGIELWGLNDFSATENTIALGGNAGAGILAWSSRQGAGGSGRISENTISGASIVGFYVGASPLLYPETTHDIKLADNDISELETSWVDVFLNGLSTGIDYHGGLGETILDDGVDNKVRLE